MRAIEARGPGDARAGMHALPAQPEALDRRAVTRELRQRPHPQRLVEAELGVVRLALRPALRTAPARAARAARSRCGCASPQCSREQRDDALGEPRAVGAERRVLHVDVEPVLLVAARFDVRALRHAAVLRVVVGALEVVERRRKRERAEARRAIELQAQAGDDAAPRARGAARARAPDRASPARRARAGCGADRRCSPRATHRGCGRPSARRR